MESPRNNSISAEMSGESVKPIKMALVLPGEISDQSWNAVGYAGLIAAKNELGVEVVYSESVQPPDYEMTFRYYAQNGYDLIVGHGSEFGDAAIRVSREFPNLYFAVINSDVRGPNLAGLDTRNEEMGYIGGYIAGLLTKTKIVAFIGATRIVAMVRAEQGFLLGAKASCPDCNILVEYIGVFDDEAKGRETALALIAKKVDVLFNNDDEAGLGSIKVAEEKGILAIGSDYDQKSIAPGAIVTSILAKVTPMIVGIAREVKEGTFKPNQVRLNGFGTGTYDITPLDPTIVTPEQAERIYSIIELVKAGKISLPHVSALPE
jgi:basic membrane protein A and related proteins